MNSIEKVDAIKHSFEEIARINTRGPFLVSARHLQPEKISSSELLQILNKLLEERFIKDYFPHTNDRYFILMPDSFYASDSKVEALEVHIKDREILINNLLLSKPHGVGRLIAFMEYLIKHSGEEITRTNIPETLQKEINGEKFTRLIHNLEFKGILGKAFFPKRSKDLLVFRKRVTSIQLAEEGISIDGLYQKLITNQKEKKQNNPE